MGGCSCGGTQQSYVPLQEEESGYMFGNLEALNVDMKFIYSFFFPTLFRSRIDVRDRDDTEVINIKNCLSGLGNILLNYSLNLTLNSTVTDQLSVLLGHFSAISSQ